MVAFDTVVEMLAINMTDCAVWPPPFVDFADDLGMAVRLVCDDSERSREAGRLLRLPQKSSYGLEKLRIGNGLSEATAEAWGL